MTPTMQPEPEERKEEINEPMEKHISEPVPKNNKQDHKVLVPTNATPVTATSSPLPLQ